MAQTYKKKTTGGQINKGVLNLIISFVVTNYISICAASNIHVLDICTLDTLENCTAKVTNQAKCIET